MEFPPRLERALRSLLGIAFALVLLVPVAASVEGLLAPGLTVLDGGGSSTGTRAVLCCLVLMGGVFLLLIPPSVERTPPAVRTTLSALGGFLGIWLAASLTSVCVADSLQNAVAWGTAGLFLVVAREVARTRSSVEQAVHFLLAVGAVVVMVSARIYATMPDDQAAVSGPFYQADVAAGFFLLLAPLAFGLALSARRWDQGVFYGGMSIALTTCIVLTYSRAGLLSAIVAILLVAVLLWPLRRAWAVALALLLMTASFCLAGLLASGGTRLTPARTVARASELVAAVAVPAVSSAEHEGAVGDSSVTARLNFYRGGWRMALSRPLLGWGPSTFGRVFPRFQDDVRFYSKYPHSAYVGIISESGFLGATAFLVFLGALGAAAVRQYQDALRRSGWNLAVVSGLIGGLVAALVHVTVDVDWDFQMLLVLFMAEAGLLLSQGVTSASASTDGSAASSAVMGVRWLLCLPLMALMAVQPFPVRAQFAEADAVAARETGRLDDAIAAQRRAVACMPFQSGAQRQLGEYLLMRAEATVPPDRALLEAALAAGDRAVSLDRYRAVNHDMQARARLAAGDRAGALLAEQEALACDPINYPKFQDTIAQLLLQDGRDREALELLESIADRYPPEVFASMWFFRRDTLLEQLAQVWFLIGSLQAKAGQVHLAEKAFARAVEMNGNLLPARFQLGTLYLNTGRPGLAFPHLRAIQRRKPEHPVSRWLMGLCYRSLGQLSRAAHLLEDAYRAMPSLRNPGGNVQIPRDFLAPDPPAPASAPLQIDAR